YDENEAILSEIEESPKDTVNQLKTIKDDEKEENKYNFSRYYQEEINDSVMILSLVNKYERMYGVTPNSTISFGKLTWRGIYQHFILGKLYKDVYSPMSFKNNNDFSKNVKVFFSPCSRTFQSSIAFLTSFISENITLSNLDDAFQSTNPKYKCRFCFQDETCAKCQSKIEMLKLNRPKQLYSKYINSKNDGTFTNFLDLVRLIENNISRYLIKKENITFFLIKNIVRLIDSHSIYQCNFLDEENIDLFNNYETDMKYVNLLFKAYEEIVMLDNYGNLMAIIEDLDTVKSVLSNLYKMIQQNAKPDNDSTNIYLYFGHDSTIINILRIIGIKSVDWPPYASQLIFELYVKNNSDNNVYLRIFYNGNKILLSKDLHKNSNFTLTDLLSIVKKKEKRILEKYKKLC
ncbi:hypothetical protein A3Q56_07527, partial [Intoshia linei]